MVHPGTVGRKAALAPRCSTFLAPSVAGSRRAARTHARRHHPRGAVVAPEALVLAGEAASGDAHDLLGVGDRGADALRDAAVLLEDCERALGVGGGRPRSRSRCLCPTSSSRKAHNPLWGANGRAFVAAAFTPKVTPMTSKPQAVSRVGLTRLVNEQDIRTPQHIKNRARNDPGILATDIKSVSCVVSSMRVMRLENRIRN